MNKKSIDYSVTLIPLLFILFFSLACVCLPRQTEFILSGLRDIFVNKLGFFYILIGCVTIAASFYLAFSRYGRIRLGALEKPRYPDFVWGIMIFTSTMAADILYWSLIEWAYYFSASPFAQTAMTLAEKHDWASAYPLFHWGLTPWSFYVLPAVAFGYLLYVKGIRKKKLSEACRPLLGAKTDKLPGKIIDLCAVIGLLAGTATTFSLATPLLSLAFSKLTGIQPSNALSIGFLLVIALVYTSAVLFGVKGISSLAKISIVCFFILLALVCAASPKIYLIETAVTAIGTVAQNFIRLSTWMDPLRLSGDGSSGFPQDWTVFYWAYWIAWFVATPFFIGSISEGRTIKNTVIGTYLWGMGGTFLSFIILGNFGLHRQVTGAIDAASLLENGTAPSEVIVQILGTLPYTNLVLVALIAAMIAFYASTFDALTLVVASYSQRTLGTHEEPSRFLRVFWALLFVMLPCALIFMSGTLRLLQTLSIIAAFPLGIILLCIVFGLFKQLRADYKKRQPETEE